MKLHHLGIACSDLGEATQNLISQWPELQAGPHVHDSDQDATLCFLEAPSGPGYELVAGPAVTGILKKGLALYHVCYEVEDLDKALVKLEDQGYRLVRAPLPAPLFNGRRVAFVHGLLGLVELMEQG